MLWLVLIAVLMWILQCALGVWQFKRFNRALKELRKEGRVAIGKARGRILAGAVVLLCIDEECRIIRGKKLQGMTIFARTREFGDLNGRLLLSLGEEDYRTFDRQTAKAVLGAVEDYRAYTRQSQQSGEESLPAGV